MWPLERWRKQLAWRESIAALVGDLVRQVTVLLAFINKNLPTAILGLVVAGCAGQRTASRAEYREQYDKPLVSPGTQFAALPPAVQNTVRAETGCADISDVVKDTSSGQITYRVYFQNHELFPPLFIATDGSLLDLDLMVAIGAPQDRPSVITGGPVSGIALNDLPPAVVKIVQNRAPDSQVDTILKQVHADQTTYLVTFKDRMHPALRLASDGTVLAGPAE